MTGNIRLLVLTISFLVVSLTQAFPQDQPPSPGLAGTLTCTTAQTALATPEEITLSCSFKPVAGDVRSYTGHVSRGGTEGFPPGKRVLIWSVHTAAESLRAADLVGLYTGQTGGDTAKRLVGGRDNGITLQPVTATSQIGGEAEPTILELRLSLPEI